MGVDGQQIRHGQRMRASGAAQIIEDLELRAKRLDLPSCDSHNVGPTRSKLHLGHSLMFQLI